ncbi:hypothetical protein NK6_7471 [Bradyrhizobium diazoefficiens]|uniref:Uncharacterized protein n=1 Tax=Bradyrhizobium diazoefficiens TaxID=1355477 RepID=A0A0E4FWE0_9BRAD|nr:hypothetical protein NK6_7471 [Bradyrhizobium diazoefficiens]
MRRPLVQAARRSSTECRSDSLAAAARLAMNVRSRRRDHLGVALRSS